MQGIKNLRDKLMCLLDEKHDLLYNVCPQLKAKYYEKFGALISQKGEEVGLSEKIGMFCKENGIDDRRSYLASLFCEELVANITEYGFSGGKHHCIDLRISLINNEIRIRIRDDCKPFDPKKWYELNHSDDPAANIGIKIVMKMSRRFEYTTTFRMNNVIIVI